MIRNIPPSPPQSRSLNEIVPTLYFIRRNVMALGEGFQNLEILLNGVEVSDRRLAGYI